jgi:hypothetical protein
MDDQQNNENNYSRRGKTDNPSLGLMAEISARLDKLEQSNSEMRAALQRGQEQGDVAYPGFLEHLAHVMRKHFYHDKPDGFDEKYPPA